MLSTVTWSYHSQDSGPVVRSCPSLLSHVSVIRTIQNEHRQNREKTVKQTQILCVFANKDRKNDDNFRASAVFFGEFRQRRQ